MPLRVLRPINPSMRGTVLVARQGVFTKCRPIKSLVKGRASTGGRNNYGRVTAPRRGGGHKKRYRMVDFKRVRVGKAVVETIEYDPFRTAWISSIRYIDGDERSYILATTKLKVGDVVESGERLEIEEGNCMPLCNIPSGIAVHNVEWKPGKGGALARASGSYAMVLSSDGKYVSLKLRSGEIRCILATCRATIGVVSNVDHKNQNLGKAGRKRWLGRRPRVRGVAMNPHDHPLGGGEGKTSGGRHPVSRKGLSSKGKITRKKNRYSNHLIRVKRKSKR